MAIAKKSTGLFFLLPGVAFLLIMGIFPLIWSLTLAFHKWKAATGVGKVFVGFQNFIDILTQDSRFWNSLRFTVLYVVVVVLVELVLGLMLAYILSEKIHFRNFFRILFLLPMAAPAIGVAFIWRMLLNPAAGVVSKILASFSINVPGLLTNASTAPYVLMLIDIWEWTPFMFMGLLAALQAFPPELYEAAAIDGANGIQTFGYITLPLLKPTIITLSLLRVIDAFKLFEIVFGVTSGGPGSSTESLSFYTYTTGFSYFNLGYACALSWVFLWIVLGISNIVLNRFRKEA